MHQTGASSKIDTWKIELIPWVEQWLEYAVSPSSSNNASMAYFFWDDEGIAMFMNKYEKAFLDDFNRIFTPVERADIFRVLTCDYFGGVVCTIVSYKVIVFVASSSPFLCMNCSNRLVVCRH